MFRVVKEAIDARQLQSELCLPQSGGYVSFEGWVRNHNDGRSVDRLEYEVYHALAQKEGDRIIARACELFDIEKASAVHREGLLAVGDVAVWIGVSAKHRDAAFRAARYIIDEIKVCLPVWKKEYYTGGEAEWVNCQGCAHHHSLHFEPRDYYARQQSVVGVEGQKKLAMAKVLVVGAGGLGSPVLEYLAGAGVGHLVIFDPDRLEPSNLPRQTLYDYLDVGEKKAELAKRRLERLNPFIRVEAFSRALSEDDAEQVQAADLVVECSDNFRTKFVVNDLCMKAKTPLVVAAVYKWQGWMQCFSFAENRACLRCLYTDQPLQGCSQTCEDAGVVGTVPGMIGVLQAQMTVEFLTRGEFTHDGKKLLFDTSAMQIRALAVPKRSDCLCSRPDDFSVDYDPQARLERNWQEVRAKMKQDDPPFLVDIRESSERLAKPTPRAWDVLVAPAGEQQAIERLAKQSEIYLFCAKGKRSLGAAQRLRAQGYEQVYSVRGGLDSAEFI